MGRGLVAALVVSALGLCLCVIPGVFTIDEPNHLAMVVSLRAGRLSPPGLDGLTPSRELAFYSPYAVVGPDGLPAHDLPPLYAFFAWPFSLLGFSGLFYLNCLSLAVAAALCFVYARRHARDPAAPWVATGLFVLGGYALEYALGLWPHMLSVALCTGGFVLASSARRSDALGPALLAGLVLGLATGVRYPNVVYAAAVGLGLLCWAPRRWEAAVSFALGMAGPLSLNALINGTRLGSHNPISKGGGYLRLLSSEPSRLDPGGGSAGGLVGELLSSPAGDALRAFWFRVVDYSARPAGRFSGFSLIPEDDTGAFVLYGVVKKAWLQSSPWVALSLLLMALAWTRRGGASSDRAGVRQELRAMSLVVGAMLLVFALAGSGRSDGTCFNQRYFLDLTPLVAAALALSLDRRLWHPIALTGGAALGGALALYAVLGAPSTAAHQAVLLSPLLLCALLLGSWRVRRRPWGRAATSAALSGCVLWAAVLHLGTDLTRSRDLRARMAAPAEAIRARVPNDSAVLVWGVFRGFLAPLQLDRDVVIVDVTRDQARDAERLSRELLARGRRVFMLANGFPRSLRLRLSADLGVRRTLPGELLLVELGGHPRSAAGRRWP